MLSVSFGVIYLELMAAADDTIVCCVDDCCYCDAGTGYLDQPWDGPAVAIPSNHLALIRKDQMIAQNTASLCGTTMSRLPLRDLVTALAVDDVTADIRDAVEDEVLALQECTKLLHDAASTLAARLQ